jgi:hypothetical protein
MFTAKTKAKLLVLYALAVAVSCWAQLIPTGSISGTVKDPNRALVPAAKVTATNVTTGGSRSATSNERGEFLIQSLLPGPYRVEVSAQGFQKFVQQVVVETAKTATVDVSLALGSVTESVEVQAQAALLQTTTATLSTTVASREISDLPLQGRNALMLEMLSPGIVRTADSGNPGASRLDVGAMNQVSYVSSNGAWQRTNDYMVDGVPDNLTDRVQYLPPVDQVQELNVVTNAYDAQYGHSGGMSVVIVTKSGTNNFHGSVYEYLQNSVFNANDFFANMSGRRKPVLVYNQFGGAVGGPIRRNKTFFFFNYEGIRTASPSTGIATVPTDLQRQGNFSQTFDQLGRAIQIYNPFTTHSDPNHPGQFVRDPFPGSVIPASMLNPASAALLSLLPSPNRPGLPFTGAQNYVNITDTSRPMNDYSIRIDHEINQNNHLFGRYSQERTESLTTPFFPKLPYGPGFTYQINTGVGYTGILSPNTVLDVTLGWEGMEGDNITPSADLGSMGFAPSFVRSLPAQYVPSISIADIGQIGYGPSSYDHDPTWGFNANIRHMQGRHSMKWGFQTQVKMDNSGNVGSTGSFNFARDFTQGPDPFLVGSNIGYGLATYLLGTMSNGSLIQSPSNEATNSPYYGIYFQDDIRATSRLSVNLGLRWEVWQPATERYNRQNVGFDFTDPNPIEAQARANYAQHPLAVLPPEEFRVLGGALFATPSNRRWGVTHLNQWSPRIGVAYRVTDKTVVRAGYGVFRSQFWTSFARQNGFSTNTNAVGTVDGITPANLFNNPFPNGFSQPTGSSLGLATMLGQSMGFLYQYAQPGYNARWNIGVQRQITPSTLVEVYYVGSTAFHLPVGSGGQIFTPAGNAEQDVQLVYLPAKYLSLGPELYKQVPNPFYGLIPPGTALSGPTIQEGQLLSHYPEFTGIDIARQTDGRSYYHSLQVTVSKRYSKGLSMLAAYTWSKKMDRYRFINASDPGPSKMIGYYDAPQRFSVGLVYELPVGPGRRWGWKSGAGGKLLEGWQVGANGVFQSGLPIALNAGVVLTGVSPTLSPDQRSRQQWFNLSSMAALPAFTLRSAPWAVASLRADCMNNWDSALIKNTSVREKLKMQLRWEIFNTVNRVQYGVPDINPVSASYGSISYQANSPRQMQVALRLMF